MFFYVTLCSLEQCAQNKTSSLANKSAVEVKAFVKMNKSPIPLLQVSSALDGCVQQVARTLASTGVALLAQRAHRAECLAPDIYTFNTDMKTFK